MKLIDKRNGGVIYYKGFGINFIHDQYEASAYSNPTFYNTNLAKLKQKINEYLRRN
jgi:hypothetical protein